MKKANGLLLMCALGALVLSGCSLPGLDFSFPDLSELMKQSETSESEQKSSSEAQSKSSSSKTQSSSSKLSSSKTQSSKTSEPSFVHFSIFDVSLEDGCLFLKGKMFGLSGDDTKLAFGLKHASREEYGIYDNNDGTWAYGKANPTLSDYQYTPVFIQDDIFHVSISIDTIGLSKGYYEIYLGPKGNYQLIDIPGEGFVKNNGRLITFQGETGLLQVEELAPVEMTEAFYEPGTGSDEGKVFVLMGGELNETKQMFESRNPYVSFANVNIWNQYRLDDQPGKVELVTRGTKGYIKADITDLPEGNYCTYINFSSKTQANLIMETAFDTKDTPLVVGTKGYSVYSNPGSTITAEFWGNLGLVITHAHTMERGEKIEGTDMYPVICPRFDASYIEMDLDSTVCPGLSSDKKMNGGKAATFNIVGLPSGEYAIYAKAHTSTGSHISTATVGLSTGEQLDETRGGTTVPGRYYAYVGDEATAEKVYTDTGDKNFAAIGYDDYTQFKWSTEAIIPSMMISEGETSFTFKHTGAGYSLYVESLRLVRIGDWAPAPKNVVFQEGAMKIEAEDYSIKHTIFTTSGEETDYTCDEQSLPSNLDGTVTEDEEASGGQYVHGVFRQGWNNSKRSNMCGELQYIVKLDADATVKIGAMIKSDMETEKVCLELKVDGTSKGNLNAANEWVEAVSNEIELSAGVHTISFLGQQLSASEQYRSVLADIDCWSLIEQAPAAE